MDYKKESLCINSKNVLYGVMLYSILNIMFSCILSYWVNATIAASIGILASILVSFTLYNARASFPKVYISNIIKYAALHLPDFVFQILMIYILKHGFGCNEFLAYIAMAVLGIPVAYLMIKKQLHNDDSYYELDFHDDPRSFIEWTNEHQILTNAGVFILMAVFFSVSNWSLLLGENLMKWDMWNAEYFAQVLTSDALASHTIPMWNPLMQHGSLWYSYINSTIWYPINMVLAYLGYTPVTIAVSYVMHLIIGSFGAFLLISLDARKDSRWTASGLCAGIVGGLLYGGCGIFLSNAQHSTIIIAAAWIPYVFYYMRRFIVYKKLYYGGMAGLCTGLIFLGGYPEVFYNLFLFLFAYTLFFCCQKKRGIIVSAMSAMFHYGIVCIFTILACALTLLPFLNNKSLIARGNGIGAVPMSYPFYTLFSVLFPAMVKIYPDLEPSMIDYYMGILVILLVPMLIKSTHKYKIIYSALAIGAFLLCQSSDFFVHSIFYRFLPMYSAFRFPTTNRAFLTLFIILLAVPVMQNIMDGSIEVGLIRFVRIIFCFCSIVAVLSGLIGNLLQDDSFWNQSKLLDFSTSAFITAAIVGGYLLIFYLKYIKKATSFSFKIMLVMLVCSELLIFGFLETPITIAKYAPIDYTYSTRVQQDINYAWEQYRNRVTDVNFAKNIRHINGDSENAVIDKVFEEGGYVVFRLSNIDQFKTTYVRNIMVQNPMVYFTNDVKAAEDVTYEEWANACDTPPEQIYVEEKLQETGFPGLKLDGSVVSVRDLTLTREDNIISLGGELFAANHGTGRVRVYLNEPEEDVLPLELLFIEDEESSYACQGNFHVSRTAEGSYIEIFFPDVTKYYSRIKISCQTPDVITAAQLVGIEYMVEDDYVDVSYFGFNDIEMMVDAPSEGYVTLLQAKHDGWSAYVDGEEQEISLVDKCFMGIHLDAGQHTIVMKFRPKEFFIGAILTGMYYVFVLVLKIRMLVHGEGE